MEQKLRMRNVHTDDPSTIEDKITYRLQRLLEMQQKTSPLSGYQQSFSFTVLGIKYWLVDVTKMYGDFILRLVRVGTREQPTRFIDVPCETDEATVILDKVVTFIGF